MRDVRPPPGAPAVDADGIDDLALTLLLEGIFRRYGYDFRSYARASVERRVRGFLSTCRCPSIAELIPRVLQEERVFADLARSLSITVTEMFRDPNVYSALRDKVLPVLRTWPHVKIWLAGCATGEEVYSMAILLSEEGLYERANLYATDFNDTALHVASEGIYELAQMRDYTRSYQAAGGQKAFSDYYRARYSSAVMGPELKRNITFANHNLATDHAFGEMHLIVCRNVLIYFNRDLQNRALTLFAESLVNGGFLCIGNREDLAFSSVASDFEVVDRAARIYKRVVR